MINRTRSIFAAGALLAVAALAVAAQDGWTLKRAPKEGEELKFRMKASIDFQGTDFSFAALIKEKVLRVEADGTYTVESDQLEGKASFAGQEVDVPSQGATISVYKPAGDVVEIRGADTSASAYRMANLNNIYYPEKPIKVGESWTKEIKADTKTGALDATATYKLLAEEKVGSHDTLKIEAKVTEKGNDGASAEFTAWLSKTDFGIVKMTGDWKNAPLAGAPGPVNAKVEMNRE